MQRRCGLWENYVCTCARDFPVSSLVMSGPHSRMDDAPGPGEVTGDASVTAVMKAPVGRLTRPSSRCCFCNVFYGWAVVACCGVCILCACPAQSYGFALFTEHYIEDSGVPRTALSTIWVTVLFGCSLLLPYIGGLSDRIGPRKLLLLVSGPYALLLGLLGQTRGPFAFCLVFFLTRLVGPGVLVLIGQTTVNRWFVTKRGRATAVLNLIMGMETIFPALALAVMRASPSWREAYARLAVGTAVALAIGGSICPNRLCCCFCCRRRHCCCCCCCSRYPVLFRHVHG